MLRSDGAGPYMEGALRLMQHVEARRRFGADADARWSSFRGDLETVDRMELMIRDADAEWPGGFGARAVFAMQGGAEDEPFGSPWQGLDPVAAEELWRWGKADPAPATLAAALAVITSAWGMTLTGQPSEPVDPTDHLVIAGPSTITATIEAFAAGAALDWSEQVVVVASSPAARQLAAAGTALLNAPRSAPIITASKAAPAIKRGAWLVASPDADPADRARGSAGRRLIVALSRARISAVGETPYSHEREGIEFAEKALPDTDPYHLWALADLLDPTTGRQHELDLVILGYSCLYVVELKAYPGLIEGDSVDWIWGTSEGRRLWRDSPRGFARRKAQILKSRLERALPNQYRAPWVEQLIFLSHPEVRLGLQPDGLLGVVRRNNFADAITRHEFPGADPQHRGRALDRPTARAVVQAMNSIGFRPRKGKMHVGSYELGALLDKTPSHQIARRSIARSRAIDRYQLVDLLRSLVDVSRDDAAESILPLVPGHEGGAPKIGDTLIPDLLPGQWTWIPRPGSARKYSSPPDSSPLEMSIAPTSSALRVGRHVFCRGVVDRGWESRCDPPGVRWVVMVAALWVETAGSSAHRFLYSESRV